MTKIKKPTWAASVAARNVADSIIRTIHSPVIAISKRNLPLPGRWRGKVLEGPSRNDTVVNRRTFLAALPTVVLAGCATHLGLADRVEIARKCVRLHPHGDEEPFDAVVRRYDPDEGVSYDDEVHETVADGLGIEAGEPLVVSDSLSGRLTAEFDIVEYRIHVCETGDGDDCRETTLFRDHFNEVEAGDVVDIVSGSSGAGVVDVHERREQRD